MYQYICIPFPQFKKKKPLKTRPPQKKERNLPTTKNHQFSVENSWKIPGNLPRLEPWNPPTQIASMDRWVNRQGRLTCVGFYSQGLNHFSSLFFFTWKNMKQKKTSTRFFLPFFDFLCLLQVVFRFFSWLSSFPRSPPQRPLLEGYPPAFFTGFRERKHQKEKNKTRFISIHHILVGGLNPAIRKVCSSNWIASPGRGENRKHLKPPASIDLI